jgi:hypothetical protein
MKIGIAGLLNIRYVEEILRQKRIEIEIRPLFFDIEISGFSPGRWSAGRDLRGGPGRGPRLRGGGRARGPAASLGSYRLIDTDKNRAGNKKRTKDNRKQAKALNTLFYGDREEKGHRRLRGAGN